MELETERKKTLTPVYIVKWEKDSCDQEASDIRRLKKEKEYFAKVALKNNWKIVECVNKTDEMKKAKLVDLKNSMIKEQQLRKELQDKELAFRQEAQRDSEIQGNFFEK